MSELDHGHADLELVRQLLEVLEDASYSIKTVPLGAARAVGAVEGLDFILSDIDSMGSSIAEWLEARGGSSGGA